ncbi:MAG: O-antigen ligase family protein [Gemmataceae bacterium]|nr:O-antigen ligase family protein [Gemmata sp.]MDW8197542.1 O-antigen ligase family protein [Gemmataceae bacterium]
MRWLLIGYMFLFIHRPFEVWPWLGELHIERVYMLFTLAVWVVYPRKRFLPNVQHAAYCALAAAVLLAWAASPWAAYGQAVVEDWLKIVVFYVLLVTCIHDEDGLKHLVVGFIAVMSLYLLHSLREYWGGRHTYRMGIARMMGVDTTLGDPNSFGASIVFALPIVVALWTSGIGGRLGRVYLSGYVALSTLCILLTGSRSSLLGLLLFFLMVIARTRYRWTATVLFAVAAPVAFVALPESLQRRFETIINPEVGPANAQESGEGRIQGLILGWQQWLNNPLTGIGPGAWRPANNTKLESHNLYGQLLGETGTLGALAFLAMLASFQANLRAIRRVRRAVPQWQNDLVFTLPTAIGGAVILLLFMGNFGHNLFRFTWLWYGGFLIIARHCVAQRVASHSWETEMEEAEPVAVDWPEGWIRHPPHTTTLP